VDAPSFHEAHRDWRAALQELSDERYIQRDGDAYRLTARGLVSLEDPDAKAVIALGDRVHAALRAHFLDEVTRRQPVMVSALAAQLNVERAKLEFALTHLLDALVRWCEGYTPDFADPTAELRLHERVTERSLADVAVELARFAAEYNTPAVRGLATPASSGASHRSQVSATNMTPTHDAPTAFISYSHDSQVHKDWVRALAERLIQDGVEVVLDQWHVGLGDDLPKFMEDSVANAGFVLLICSEAYIAKADARAGGTGYESGLIASLLLNPTQIAAKGPARLIPVVRQTSTPRQLPRFVAGRVYADLSEGTLAADATYEQLVRRLHGTPQHEPPPIGHNPFAPVTPSVPRIDAGGRTVSNGTVHDLRRALRRARTEGAEALLARQGQLPMLAGATPQQRDDEMLSVLNTHEKYLRMLARSAHRGELSPSVLAEELEDVMHPKDWPQSGPTRVVELPRALGWAAHRLAGAALVEHGKAGEVAELAREGIRLTDEAPQPLILTPALTGWPIRGGHSREAWDCTRRWPAAFAWLIELFGDIDQYWTAMVAHSVVLNWAEFCWRLQHGPAFDEIRADREHGPTVPLYFWNEPAEVQRQAFRLVKHDAAGLRAGLGVHIQTLDLEARWRQWISFQRSWLAIELLGNSSVEAAPHEALLMLVLAAR